VDNTPRKASPWIELRWWLLSASVFTIIAAICVASIMLLIAWHGYAVLLALGTLPFIAEAWIQFRTWWRRILWAAAGAIIGMFILNLFPNGPAWNRGPIPFLLPGCMEFIAASSIRNRPWTWLIVTPALFGLSEHWMEPAARMAEKTMAFVATHIPVANGPASELYFGAAIFGTVLFTRALTGSLIASRRRPISVEPLGCSARKVQ
jgi:hypothetical protein